MVQKILRKELFDLPDDIVYLDGNSLGPLPTTALKRADNVMRHEWGNGLIRAWNTADWMSLPQKVGDKIAPLIGAPKGSVATGDTLSIKVFQALGAALKMLPDRRVILSDKGNFPTDLYMAQGLIDALDNDYVLSTPAPENVLEAIDDTVAAVMLTHVDYRSGRLHDMAAITKRAHDVGAVVIWDLAHSAGALPINLTDCRAEFAVGCTYKYFNGGPGSPAFIYVRPDLADQVKPILAGWMGHEAPFAMDPKYQPASSTERLRVGTPPIIQLSVLDTALDIWEGIDMTQLRAASIDLSELFITEVEARCPELKLASPRNPEDRGSQVSFEFEQGYAVMQALIDHGIIGDFRAPNIMRFGFTPMYLDQTDILKASEMIEYVISNEIWKQTKYQTVSRVT